jgi:2-alkyl-3-oxoalkanoate reductase
MRVAVTGASGFVGGAVCRDLAARGWTVLAFGRRPAVDAERVAGAPYRAWDISSGPLPDAPDVDAVVHAAARVSADGVRTETRRAAHAVNVTGTTHVLTTWPYARLVHVSSASVYHPWRAQVQAREDEVPEPDAVRWPSVYGWSKALAEGLVLGLRPDAVVLRPHAVYGPGDTTLLPRIEAAVIRGVLPLPGSGRQRHALTRVETLARACALACAPHVPGGPYSVTDAEPVVLADAVAQVLRARGRPVRVQPLGHRLPAALATGAELARRGLRRPGEPVLSRYAVSHLALERTFDLTRARTLLGLDPSPPALADAATW